MTTARIVCLLVCRHVNDLRLSESNKHQSTTTSFLGVHYDWEGLTGSVHRCRLPFCDVTIGLVQGGSGALLIDTGTTLVEAAAIDADVREIAGRAVTHVVLTHKHFDHVLGASQFTGAEVFCAPEVVEYLSSATDQLRDDALSYGADAAEVDRAIAALKAPQHGISRRRHRSRRSQRNDRPPGPRSHNGGPGRAGDCPRRRGRSGRGRSPVILSRSPPTRVSTPIRICWPGRQRLIGCSRSGDRTPSTSRVTEASSTPSSSAASGIG